MASVWTSGELDTFGSIDEIQISAARPSGGLYRWTPIWVVRVDDDVFVRAGGGLEAGWYRHAADGQAHILVEGIDRRVSLELRSDHSFQEVADQAYRDKYGASSFLGALVSATAQTSTSRLIPAGCVPRDDRERTDRRRHNV
jgi:hypothetical protein